MADPFTTGIYVAGSLVASGVLTQTTLKRGAPKHKLLGFAMFVFFLAGTSMTFMTQGTVKKCYGSQPFATCSDGECAVFVNGTVCPIAGTGPYNVSDFECSAASLAADSTVTVTYVLKPDGTGSLEAGLVAADWFFLHAKGIWFPIVFFISTFLFFGTFILACSWAWEDYMHVKLDAWSITTYCIATFFALAYFVFYFALSVGCLYWTPAPTWWDALWLTGNICNFIFFCLVVAYGLCLMYPGKKYKAE